jgi:lipopolysaccharide/colanic/teichoic acid biosynthesis glycosyltransferase
MKEARRSFVASSASEAKNMMRRDSETAYHAGSKSYARDLKLSSTAPQRAKAVGFGHAFHRLLVVADLAALLLSSLLVLALLSVVGRQIDTTQWLLTVAVMVPAWILIAYLVGLYGQMERRLNFDYVAELTAIISASTAWCWFAILVRGVIFEGGTALVTPALTWLVMVPVLLICRSLARSFARSRPWYVRSIALIGDGSTVDILDKRIARHPEWGLSVGLEVVRIEGSDTWHVRRPSADGQQTRVGSVEHVEGPGVMAVGLTALVEDAAIDRVMVAGGLERLSSRTELVHTLIDRGIAVDYMSGGPETLYSSAMPQHLEGLSFLSSRPSEPKPFAMVIKRVMDLVMSTCLLIATAPILAWAAIRIKMDSPGPVVFKQERSGLFLYIFMDRLLGTIHDGAHDQRDQLRQEAQANGFDNVLFKLDDDPRVTKFGQKLRNSSLDELPQLWNVLIGDMSMVGPRPLVPEEAAEAHGMYRARSRVKPGIAGPWQAEGRSDIPFEDMLRLDYSYVAGWSLGEDVRLLLRTFSAVVGRSGAK